MDLLIYLRQNCSGTTHLGLIGSPPQKWWGLYLCSAAVNPEDSHLALQVPTVLKRRVAFP